MRATAQESASQQAVASTRNATSSASRQPANPAIRHSPFVAAQRQAISSAFGSVVQRKGDDYSDSELLTETSRKEAEGIPETPLGPALKFQRFRKLNRIGGALKKQVAIPGIPAVVDEVKAVFSTVKTDPALAADTALNVTAVHDQSLLTVRNAADPTTTVTHAAFEAYSMLGPLDYWMKNKTESADIQKALRALRLKMAQRSGVSIIAHRGHGPTNRTRGGLIKQTDPRRTGRPAENSKEAFNAAFGSVTKHLATPALDGIECDVFLSSDLVPILSHEGGVKEQLSTARQLVHSALVGDTTHIEDLTADQLKLIQRTDTPESAFLTLGDFLNETIPTAQAYFTLTGKPLRVEIEMKGHAKKTGSVIADYGDKLISAVAKIVSRFKKSNPIPCWEIILFNNVKDDAKKFGALRSQKSHLGSLYTGLGSDDTALGTEANVDELRVSATNFENPRKSLKDEKNFIVTYVPGAERPYGTPKDPLGELDFGSSQRGDYARGVNKDMANTEGKEGTRIKTLLKDTKTATNVHLLTDIPANAEKYKEYQRTI